MGVQTNACNNTSISGFTSASICPSGWRLPTGQATTGEFTYLNNAVNSGTTSGTNADAGLLSNWLAVYSGRYNSGLDYQGTYGYYWSSTANTATSAYYLGFNNSSVNSGYNNGLKYTGNAVRCVQ